MMAFDALLYLSDVANDHVSPGLTGPKKSVARVSFGVEVMQSMPVAIWATDRLGFTPFHPLWQCHREHLSMRKGTFRTGCHRPRATRRPSWSLDAMARPSSAQNGRRRSTELDEVELATPRRATRVIGKRHEMTYRKNPFSELVERTVDALKGTISEVRGLEERSIGSTEVFRGHRSPDAALLKSTEGVVLRPRWAMCKAFWPRSVRGRELNAHAASEATQGVISRYSSKKNSFISFSKERTCKICIQYTCIIL